MNEKRRSSSARPVTQPGQPRRPAEGGGKSGGPNRPRTQGTRPIKSGSPGARAGGKSQAISNRAQRRSGPRQSGGAKSQGMRAQPTLGKRSIGSMLGWGAITLTVFIVVALVIVKVSSGSSPSTYVRSSAASANVVRDVTTIPASVFNTVGVHSSVEQISPPIVVPRGQAPLTFDGKPEMLYYGAEYCPYCAAERWAMVAALARFGTFSNLGTTASSSSDVFPNTRTFTFYKSSY